MPTTQLFVSHISEERDVAAALKAMLQEAFSGDVEVFTSSDTKSIAGGQNWLDAVHHALEQASAVIVLCSRASIQRSWVQFELGAAWMRQIPIVPLCHSGLKVTDLPMPLSLRNGSEITEKGLERLYWAVADQVKTKRAPDATLMQRHLAFLKDAESAFADPLVQFELFMDILLPAPGRLAYEEIPAETVVEANDESLRLFGYLKGPLKWHQIEKSARKIRDQRWLVELQKCIFLASRNEYFRPVQAILHTPDHGSFQPQLSKREIQPDGTCRFHVHLVKTVVAPLTEVQNDFGLLATMLRLGLRFRYEVIDKCTRSLKSVASRRPAELEAAVSELIAQMRGAVETIENDALSRGSERFVDPNCVVDLFARDEDQDTMIRVQRDWEEARALLFCDAPKPDLTQIREAINLMRDVNFQFMQVGTRRFHEMVSERW
jgi:hypothetical protein